MNEKYVTVLRAALAKGQPAICHALGEISIEGRPRQMRDFFLSAVRAKQDEAAAIYLSLLFQSIRDVQMDPFISRERGETSISAHSKGFDEANAKAYELCAQEAMALYPQLPKPKQAYRDGPYEPMLLATKKSLLETIAQQWRKTRDEQLANECFRFLLELAKTDLFHEEWKQFEGILREATDHFSAQRLSRNFAQLVSSEFRHLDGCGSYVEKVARLILIAWARNNDFGMSHQILSTCQPLADLNDRWHATGPAFTLLGQCAQDIALLEQATRDLLARLGGSSVVYPSMRRILLSIKETVHPHFGKPWQKQEEDAKREGQDRFDKIREHVLAWQQAFPGFPLTVKLEIVADNKAVLFAMDRTFD